MLNNRIIVINKQRTIEKIKNEDLPLYIWGIGNVALNISNNLKRENIDINGYLLDVPFHVSMYNEKNVYSFDDTSLPNEYALVVGHSKYELSDSIKNKYRGIKEVYCICEMNLGIENEHDYILNHELDAEEVYEWLADDLSRDIFVAYHNSMLNDDFRYLIPYVEDGSSYFNNSVWSVRNDESYVDIGAYNGDTIKTFLECCCYKYEHIYAFEPDPINYEQLKCNIRELGVPNIVTVCSGIGEKETEAVLALNGNQESKILFENDEKRDGIKIEIVSLDSFFSHKGKISFIKSNIPYNESALIGGKSVIRKWYPRIAIAIGVNEALVIRIPKLIKKLYPDYKIYLRQPAGMPARLLLLAQT